MKLRKNWCWRVGVCRCRPNRKNLVKEYVRNIERSIHNTRRTLTLERFSRLVGPWLRGSSIFGSKWWWFSLRDLSKATRSLFSFFFKLRGTTIVRRVRFRSLNCGLILFRWSLRFVILIIILYKTYRFESVQASHRNWPGRCHLPSLNTPPLNWWPQAI
jgi:hypothetical protein